MIKGFVRQRYGLLLLLSLIWIVQPVIAQRPEMNLLVNWTPENQLVSVAGDDREVTMEVSVAGNVQFWAVRVQCTIGRGGELSQLTSFELSSAWGGDGNAITEPLAANTGEIYQGNTFEVTATRLGFGNAALGENGSEYNMLLFTATFDVAQMALTRNQTVTVTCRTISFLDRNGAEVVRGRQVRLTDLTLLPGYQLTGELVRQGARSNDGIDVECNHIDPNNGNTLFTGQTDRNGQFVFPATGFLRNFGWYDCRFTDASGVLLDGQAWINLQTPTYELLPTFLYTGDGNNDNQIATAPTDDLDEITQNWGLDVDPFTDGDLNGDGDVDETDLALFAANVGLNGGANGLNLGHTLYGMPTSLDVSDVTKPNSQVYWGTSLSGGVTPMNSRARNNEFWPQMSPDGTSIAFVAFDTRANRYNLQVSTNGRAAAVTTRTFTDSAFAPSWSPDGSSIAFICSFEDTTLREASYLTNRGNICIQNRVDRGGDTLMRLDVEAEIFPPAWVEYAPGQYGIIYSEGDVLKFYDLSTGTDTGFIGNSAQTGDMPIVINYYDSVSGQIDNILFFRDDSKDIQVDTVTYAAGDSEMQFGTRTEVRDDTNAIDYYDVSPTLDVMYYTFEDQTLFTNLNFDDNDNDPTDAPLLADGWSVDQTHRVDGALAVPALNASDNSVWTPDDEGNLPSFYSATRITFDWIP